MFFAFLSLNQISVSDVDQKTNKSNHCVPSDRVDNHGNRNFVGLPVVANFIYKKILPK